MHTHNPKVGKSERKIKVKGAQIEGLPTFFFLSFHLQHNYLIKGETVGQANYTKKTIQA